MEAWATEFLAVWQQNREKMAETVLESINNNPLIPLKVYTLNDMMQMVDGAYAMIAEELSGADSDVFDTYMNAVVPGILAQGQPLSVLVAQVSANGILLTTLLVPLLQVEHRARATQYMANFFYKQNLTNTKIGLDMGIKA